MIDERELREMLQRRAGSVSATPTDAPKAIRRARRRLLANGALAMLAAAAIAVATFAGVDAIRTAPVPADLPTPGPAPDVLRANGEVLSFTGDPAPFSGRAPGDLVAVNPETGEERVLLEDLGIVYSARWSADGRWVAYETSMPQGEIGLRVVGASQDPRLVATGGRPYGLAPISLSSVVWSPAGGELAAIARSRLITFDPVTGETTDLGSVDVDRGKNSLLTPTPAWSPDRTRIAVGGRDWALYSVDVRSGDRSLLVRLPGEEEEFHMIDEIVWSPDGAHIAVVNRLDDGPGRLYLMDADGSNVRVLDDDYDGSGVAWSPDGTRLAFAEGSERDRDVRIWIAPMDGGAPTQIGSLPIAGCRYEYACDLTWSSDGSQIVVGGRYGVDSQPVRAPRATAALRADGSGQAMPVDEMTYRSWSGGSYSCECL